MTDVPEARHRGRRRRSSRSLTRAYGWIGGTAALVLVAGAIGCGMGKGGDSTLPPRVAEESGRASIDVLPSRSPPPDPTASTETTMGVRATRITIERLGIDLPIVPGDGIDAPMNQAAHFPGTAWPDGASKNIYIYAHAQEGMFLSLWEAQPGDEVMLELVDGTERTYVVTEVLPEVAWDAVEYTQPTETEQLTLQTSTSDTITAPRFVVIAVPKS